MKNKTLLAVLCLLLVAFVSCSKASHENASADSFADNSNEVVSSKAEDIQETYKEVPEEAEPVYVSPLAAENFLLPLEDYSWEREYVPEYVMLHFTSAVVPCRDNPYDISRVRKIFEESEISIHYIVDRDGNVQCYIPESRAAWHAGRGCLAGDERLTNAMNKYSIGIEILAIGSKTDMAQYLTSAEYDDLPTELIGFTDAQYNTLKTLVKDICKRNSIPFDKAHVIGHNMYNPAKTDPGELFSWDNLFAE